MLVLLTGLSGSADAHDQQMGMMRQTLQGRTGEEIVAE